MSDKEDPYRYFDGAKFREDDRCKRCGCELNGEAAEVNGEVWCHPCADEVDATDKALQLDKNPPDAGTARARQARP